MQACVRSNFTFSNVCMSRHLIVLFADLSKSLFMFFPQASGKSSHLEGSTVTEFVWGGGRMSVCVSLTIVITSSFYSHLSSSGNARLSEARSMKAHQFGLYVHSRSTLRHSLNHPSQVHATPVCGMRYTEQLPPTDWAHAIPHACIVLRAGHGCCRRRGRTNCVHDKRLR